MGIHADPRTASGTEELVAMLRHMRFSQGMACPRCHFRRIQRWGHFSGRQRYRCMGCLRTFSDLTGTPAAYLKKVELLPAYAGCMARSVILRQAASEVGIALSTAFRWRHRLLDALRRSPIPKLSGWIEFDLRRLAHSRKGERFLDRPPRRRGVLVSMFHQGPQVTVLTACDRLGHVVTDVIDGPSAVTTLRPEAMAHLLDGHVEGEPVLVSNVGRFGACARLARLRGWGFEHVRSWDGPAHLETVRGYLCRMRRWFRRFNGVATRYLPNYLRWHHHLDARHRHGLDICVLRWPLGAGFG